MVVIMCVFIQLSKYQVKDMNAYIELLIGELLKLWVGVTMYDVSRQIEQKEFQFHGILVWPIHDSLGLTHFRGI